MRDSDGIQALLFDLGGVLIEIDFERVFRHWARHSRLSAAGIRERFEVDTVYQRHERGEIDGAAYFAHLRRLLLLEASDAEIATGWNAVFVGPIEPSLALVRRMHKTMPCFCFTNTNPTHQASWSRAFPELGSLFADIFVSSEMGVRKPERLAFETVAARMGIQPARILFFDDLAQNVEGARAAGMRAVLVRSPEDIREGLARVGGD